MKFHNLPKWFDNAIKQLRQLKRVKRKSILRNIMHGWKLLLQKGRLYFRYVWDDEKKKRFLIKFSKD